MKRKLFLAFLLLPGLLVRPARAAEVEMPGNAVVSGSVTATSFICAGLPCLNSASISPGTAGISITGSAAYAPTADFVTYGVYINGSYADPLWLTSLAGSKITGSIPGNAAYAPTATFVTNGVYTTGSYANPSWITSLSISKINNIITPAKIGFYDKVAIVAKTGGDYNDPAVAMSSAAVAVWCGTPSLSNRCLLKIMPGVYSVTSPVMMQRYIDIEGSGEKVTKITSTLSTSNPPTDTVPPDIATVMQSYTSSVNDPVPSEIRFLTVENTGTGLYTAAMSNNSGKISLAHVTVMANGAGGSNHYGIFSGQCLDLPMRDVTVSASGGAYNYGISIRLSAPTMQNVTATATGGAGSENRGIWIYNNLSPSYIPTLTNVTASASGGTSYGILIEEQATPKLNRVTATALGGTYIYGIASQNSTPTLTAVTATASGGTYNYGLMNFYLGKTSVVKINDSVIKGTTKSFYNRGGLGATYIGNTQLDGTVTNETGMTLTCVGAYSGTYTALNNLCK